MDGKQRLSQQVDRVDPCVLRRRSISLTLKPLGPSSLRARVYHNVRLTVQLRNAHDDQCNCAWKLCHHVDSRFPHRLIVQAANAAGIEVTDLAKTSPSRKLSGRPQCTSRKLRRERRTRVRNRINMDTKGNATMRDWQKRPFPIVTVVFSESTVSVCPPTHSS